MAQKIGSTLGALSRQLRTFASKPGESAHPFNGVHPYHCEYKDKLISIARNNVISLVGNAGWLSQSGREHAMASNILPALEQKLSEITSRVCLKNGEPIGFIHYRIYQPWYKRLLRMQGALHAEICQLVVDKTHRNNGYGSMLLTAALADCQSKSVDYVYLWTNGFSLEEYYKKHGFEYIQHNRIYQFKYAMRLKDRPLFLIGG